MSFNAHTLAQTLRLVADETATLRTFIDDLDGWDGKDLDTGTNAYLTFTALARALETVPPNLTLHTALDIAVDAGIRHSVGHVGQLITLVFSTWYHALNTAVTTAANTTTGITPIALRHMLSHTGISTTRDQHNPAFSMNLAPAVAEVLSECRNELAQLGHTLPESHDILNLYAAHSQFALVEATNHTTGRIDPGAAVLTVLFTCFDAVVRNDPALLSSLAHMLADLAASPAHHSPRPHPPEAHRAFTVDTLISASRHDITATLKHLNLINAKHSCVGKEDLFGLGEWRLHIDTSAPLAALPRHLSVKTFTVTDARPHHMLGVDLLNDGVTHRGVRILERRPAQPVQRAHVLVLTHAPGMLEYYAQAGTIAILNPNPDDLDIYMTLTHASSTGVTLIIPTSDTTKKLAHTMGSHTHPGQHILVADCNDDLSALVQAQATGTLFIPQPGGYEAAHATEELITQTTQHAAQTYRSTPIHGTDPLDIIRAIDTIKDTQPQAWRLLIANHDPMGISAITQQLISAIPPHNAPLEIIDAGQTHTTPTIIQGLV